MTSRRDRPITGRSNLDATTFSKTGNQNYNNNNNNNNNNNTGRSDPFNNVPRSNRTGRSDTSELSTGEVLRRLRDKSTAPQFARDQAEIEALGDYNAFSRPRVSRVLPLRSALLDPNVNNFPQSKTRSELAKKIRVSGAPHPSYDLDADGYVSQEDYRLAKRFDFDGNGVLDPGERQIGKRVLADEFFKTHAHHLEVFGPSFATSTHKQNVEALTNAYSFERAYDRLKSIERTLIAESSKPILECMQVPEAMSNLVSHNYYTNKFDATAWNDFDAIPRSSSKFGLDDHGGSRKRLLFSRRMDQRAAAEQEIKVANDKKPFINTRKSNAITNVATENS